MADTVSYRLMKPRFQRGVELLSKPNSDDQSAFTRAIEKWKKPGSLISAKNKDIKYQHTLASLVKQSAFTCLVQTHIKISDDADSGESKGSNVKLLRYEFERDQVYLGEVLDNKAHGHGVFQYKGCQYGGRWENGMESIGCYLWPNRVQYYGLWEDGYRHGNGVEKHQGYVYKGEWVKDSKQGYGVASSQSGCKYEGTWYNGQHDGYGVEVYKDGGFYAGQFNGGIRDGHGVRVFTPNNKLRETFIKDTVTDTTSEVPSEMDLERHLGSQIFEPVDENDKVEIYRGHWKEDKRHGPGIERNAKGEVYKGTFKDNMRHGYGVLEGTGGHVFYGRWKKNKLIKNKRTISSSSQRAAIAAHEGCAVAERKTWLALSRAQGARRFALWAVHSQREAYKHYALSEEKEREALALIEIGNVGVNIIASNGHVKDPPSSPGLIARNALSRINRITDMFSPLPSRRSTDSMSEENDTPPAGGAMRKASTTSRFLMPSNYFKGPRRPSEDSLKSIPPSE